jgi:outer membrane protein assembly factor BamB/predicted phosphodiesterase
VSGGLTRRRLLAGAGAAAVSGVLAGPGIARAGHRSGGLRAPFAVLADSHVDPASPTHGANLRAVFDHIGAQLRGPEFLLHVGDVVESGLPPEYAEWDALAPDGMRERLHAVPGNHEVRWDEWAKGLYFARFAQTPYSFDAAGVHVVALDPTQLLQEPGYLTEAHIAWLVRDLRAARRPAIVMVHYPMGGDAFFVGNQDRFWAAIEPFDVRAVIAGHVHREEVARTNGLHVVTLPGILDVAAYHWVAPADGRPALTITRAQRDAAGVWAVTPVAEVPLAGDGPGQALRPQHVRVTGDARVEVELSPRAAAASARARVWPEATWGGGSAAGWLPLAPDGRRWSGTLPTSGLAPGRHKVQVQVADAAGALWESHDRLELPGDGTLRLAWERDLGAPIQAGLASLGESAVVAATVAGRVVAVEPARRWSADVGGAVLGTPLVDPAGQLVVVGTAARQIVALQAEDGHVAWRFATAQPALGAATWTDAIERAPRGAVLVSAGRTLYALDARDGGLLWQAETGGIVAGRPAVTATTAVVGSGDGRAHAFDLATGEPRWQVVLSARESPYRTMIYGPWWTQATTLPADRVLLSTVSAAWALDGATGAQAWRIAGGWMYHQPLLLGDRLALASERGEVVAVRPDSGAELWRGTMLERVLGGSPVSWGDRLAVAGVNGLVATFDPATGAPRGSLHPGVEYVHSGPATAGELLAVGSQDGLLRALSIG